MTRRRPLQGQAQLSQEPKAWEVPSPCCVCGRLHEEALLLQLLFASAIAQAPQGVDEWASAAAVAEMGRFVVAYAAVTIVGAVALPPHRLPYQLGVLPSWMRWGSALMRARST